MADNQPLSQEQINAAVQALFEQKMAGPGVSATPGFSQQGGALLAPQPLSPNAISLPVKLTLPDGRELRTYLHFSTEDCQSDQDIIAKIHMLAQRYPVDAFMPKQQQGNWGGGGGGGYGQGGGGGQWNRGGGGRGRW